MTIHGKCRYNWYNIYYTVRSFSGSRTRGLLLWRQPILHPIINLDRRQHIDTATQRLATRWPAVNAEHFPTQQIPYFSCYIFHFLQIIFRSIYVIDVKIENAWHVCDVHGAKIKASRKEKRRSEGMQCGCGFFLHSIFVVVCLSDEECVSERCLRADCENFYTPM